MLSRRAFTILELCAVVAVIAVITAAAVPVYDVLVRRARADEARTVLHAIAHAELRHFRDRGGFLACAPGGEVPDGPGSFPSDEPCWRELGIQLSGDVRYRYGVTLQDGSFLVTAEGDLDRDGQTSLFTLRGQDLSVDVRDELE